MRENRRTRNKKTRNGGGWRWRPKSPKHATHFPFPLLQNDSFPRREAITTSQTHNHKRWRVEKVQNPTSRRSSREIDHLARRQLDHSEVCPFCEQEETISHLLSEYAFAQQEWHSVLAHYGPQTITHPKAVYQFLDWFLSAAERVGVGEMKGAQSLM